jgi:hypothetical protein
MRHSSRVSAWRRELNSHEAAKPQIPSHARRPAKVDAWVECIPRLQATVPSPLTNSAQCLGPLRPVKATALHKTCWAFTCKACAGGFGRHNLLKGSVPRRLLQRGAVVFRCSSPGVGLPWRARSQCTFCAALPNPSFKPSPNGVPRGPGRRYAVHFRHPGPRVTPLVPA